VSNFNSVGLLLGLVVSGLTVLIVVHNLFYAAREVMCPTHLGHPFKALLLPASKWDRENDTLFYIRWIKARRHLFRQIIAGLVAVLLVDSWRSHMGGIFGLEGLWLTIPITVATLWNAIADARMRLNLEGMPEEAEAMELARMELDRGEQLDS
jgi:hypothetical protein